MIRLMQAIYIVLVFAYATPAMALYVQIDDGGSLQEIADVTVTSSATLIDAADLNRATLNCTNNDASVNVRWGSSAVTATSGQRVKAGSSIEVRNKYAVYMISEGANVTISCTKEVR